MENRYLTPYRSEEFQEEDVWAVIKTDESNVGRRTRPRSISRRLPCAARRIPGNQTHQNSDDSDSKFMQNSAPVNVPDWSKIYGKSPSKNNNGSYCPSSLGHTINDSDYGIARDGGAESEEDGDNGDDDDDDDKDKDRLPPHEWLAKKLARSQISSFSVCEGVGRTLKGRDLSRVRNAVLSKTGFL